jgi:DNA-binding XRE family transcriptional regulator
MDTDVFLDLSGNSPRPRRRRSPLARARMSAGLTQADLGSAIGMSSQWISAIEVGELDASLQQKIAVAGILNMPLALLFPDECADSEDE